LADDPKPKTSPAAGSAGDSAVPSPPDSNTPSTATSEAPAPAGVDPKTGAPADGGLPNANGAGAGGPQPDPLSDGTKPTILKTGAVHRSVPKGKTSITSVYRRADIMTTLLTFIGAVVAGAIILGADYFITKSKNATPTKAPTKVTTLDKSELEKLDSFFNGNSAGKSSEVLTISSSTLFQGRVGMSSDLKVVGGVQVSGTTALADLTVDKTSTLGITNIRGALTVSGPLNLQSPAILGGGATVNGNLSVTGNGSFGGTLAASTINVSTLTVSGTLNLNGHLNIGGSTPSAAPDQAAGTGASANISGNDAAGTVSVLTGTVPNNAQLGGALVKVTFKVPYSTQPTVVITPNGRDAALLQPYIIKTAQFFIVGSAFDALSHTSYSFDYWIVQ
jgi:hypothetical protein